MSNAVYTTSELRDMIVPLLPKYDMASACLFGSYARGEARTDSDIDLRILCDEDRRFSIMNLAAFGNRIQQATGKSVDIVSKRVIDNDELREAIKRDGVVVYER